MDPAREGCHLGIWGQKKREIWVGTSGSSADTSLWTFSTKASSGTLVLAVAWPFPEPGQCSAQVLGLRYRDGNFQPFRGRHSPVFVRGPDDLRPFEALPGLLRYVPGHSPAEYLGQ